MNNVTLADVKQFYTDYFVPANAYLVVIGDINFDEVKKLVTKNFTPWTKATPPSFTFSDPANAQYTQINFVDVPNAVQSEIAVQNLVDLKKKDANYLSATLANDILGGGGEGRLFLNLREDKGYTYGSYSRIGNDKYAPSRFRASASVRNVVTDSSVVEILKEIDRIATEPVSQKELDNAKAKYVGRFVLALERPSTIAGYALDIEREGLPKDYYKTYLQRIDAITVDDIQTSAQKYFSTKNARVVVAGKGSEVLENLEKVSFNGKTVPVNYFDKYANKVEKPNYDAALPEGVTVQSIIDKYFEAIGGKAEVEKIQSLKLVYEGTAMGATIKIEEKRTADKFAQISYMNNAAMGGVIAKGDELYMTQAGNKVPLPPDMQKDMMNALGIFAEQRITANPAAKVAGTEMVNGKEAIKIEVPGTVVQTTYFYDMETGLKVKETSVTSMNGQTQNQEVLLKEYTEVDGIKFPSIRISPLGPQMTIETKLLEALINKEVTDADFE